MKRPLALEGETMADKLQVLCGQAALKVLFGNLSRMQGMDAIDRWPEEGGCDAGPLTILELILICREIPCDPESEPAKASA